MQFISIYTNVVTGEHYSAEGKSFANGLPEIYVNSQFLLYWQLYHSTPNADTDSVDVQFWQKTDRFAGCVAKFTCDNDWTHKISGKVDVKTNISAGQEFPETLDVTINNASTANIASSGEVTIYNAHGQFESILFYARQINGNIVTLYIGTGVYAKYGHSGSENATVSQEVLFQAFSDPDLSESEKGLFVFDVVATSTKLQKVVDTVNSGTIAIKALEILPYMLMEDGSIVQYPAYQYTKASLRTTMAEAGTPAQPGDVLKSEIAAEIKKQIAEKNISSDTLSVLDAGNYFVSENVEGALQEIGATLNGLEAELAEV